VEIKNGSKLEKRYQELQKANPKIAVQILASFDPHDALQMDIAREYLSRLDKKVLEKNEKLAKLFELLKETKVFPFESLGTLLVRKESKIKLQDDISYKQVTIKLYGKGVLVRQEVMGAEIKTEAQFIVDAGDFIMSKIDARNGAFGIVPEILEGAVVTTSFPYFEIQTDKVNPQYLESIVTQKSFYDQINSMVSGATGRRSVEVDNFLELQIPLPPLDVQNEIVEKIEKQKQIIKGAEKIEESFQITIENKNTFEQESIEPLVDLVQGLAINSKTNHLLVKKSNMPLLRIADLRTDDYRQFIDENKVPKKCIANENDIIYTRTGQVGLVFMNKKGVVHNNCFRVLLKTDKLDNRYLYYYLQDLDVKNYLIGLTNNAAQPDLTHTLFNTLKIHIPPLEIQSQIVEELDLQMQALEGVRLLKSEAQKRIEEILSGVWGE